MEYGDIIKTELEKSRIYDDVPKDKATYMFIGEAWGDYEAAERKPFRGASGYQLNRMLAGVGIDRERECYVTNVINERPIKNNFGIYYENTGKKKPTQKLFEAQSMLREKIRRVKPDVIITLGDEPLKAILGNDFGSIEKYFASILSFENIPLIPCFHPSAIVRGGKSHWYLPAAIHCLNRAKLAAKKVLIPHKPKIKICRTVADTRNFLQYLQNHKVAFDIETTMDGGERILCIGFASEEPIMGFEAFVVNFIGDSPEVSLQKQRLIKSAFRDITIGWIGQNAYSFDIPVLERNWGVDVGIFYMDTMIAHILLDAELPHDLGTLTAFFTQIPYYKNTSETDLLNYNGLDAVATMLAAQRLEHRLRDSGMWDIYQNFMHPLLEPLVYMQNTGVRIDREYKEKLKKEMQGEMKQLQKSLDAQYQKYTNTDMLQRRLRRFKLLKKGGRKTVKLPNLKKGKFTRRKVDSQIKKISEKIKDLTSLNVSSPKKLAYFLYTVLRLPKRTKKGKVTTDSTALNGLYLKTQHEFLKTIINLRKLGHAYSKYGKMQLSSNDRVHTKYKFVESGRLSSGEFDTK